eukprot:77756-Prymnesium_polylepis.1
MSHHETIPVLGLNRRAPKPVAEIVGAELRIWPNDLRRIPRRWQRKRYRPRRAICAATEILTC